MPLAQMAEHPPTNEITSKLPKFSKSRKGFYGKKPEFEKIFFARGYLYPRFFLIFTAQAHPGD